MRATAEIIDLRSVRERRKSASPDAAVPMAVPAVAWVPMWFCGPVWVCSPMQFCEFSDG
jgi:hypothetical protein